MFAQVIVDINHSELDKIFEYSIPKGMPIATGMRVLVPFGRSKNAIEGYVIGIEENCLFDESRIKAIIKSLEDYCVFNADQLELAKFMMAEYNCNLVDVLRIMIPAQMRGMRVSEKKIQTLSLANGYDSKEAKKLLIAKNGKCKSPVQMSVLEFLESADVEIALSDVYAQIPNASSAVKSLIAKGHLSINEHSIYRTPYNTASAQKGQLISLTIEQQNAIDIITQNDGGSFLLHGVTGSGKTEVYLRCIAHYIDMGKAAIVLVPEISLTPQTVERFRQRFSGDVALIHSRLSAGERYDEWRRILKGEVKVVVGARSAVFAPFKNLGIIIIDEEHEDSYKSDKTPRYDAISVAKKRCELKGASLILGSATPALETYFAAKAGSYEIIELNQRVNKKPLPQIETIDMRIELENGNRSIFSAALFRSMKQCLKEKQQMILFLNRRGYSTFISCRGCGYIIKCESCDIAMTYHKTHDEVRCHYCGSVKKIPPECPECKKPYLKHFGIGTQQIEEQVKRFFPEARILRMDHDTTQGKDAHYKLLSAFSNEQADILIGTQMIAKGLDFPMVTLVGVIAADAALFVPDYRSAERAFDLITQVAGRAGRNEASGRVIVQTYSPEHPSIVCASTHDYKGFYQYEIECRKQNEFPPFTDFARFLFWSEDENMVNKTSLELGLELESNLHKIIEINNLDYEDLIYVSSNPCPLHFLRGKYRSQIVVKIIRGGGQEYLMNALKAFAQSKRREGLAFNFEINPQNMA